MLADLTGTIEDAVVEAGYAGLAAVMAIEVVFPPIPSEIVLPFAGFQVAKGELGFVPGAARLDARAPCSARWSSTRSPASAAARSCCGCTRCCGSPSATSTARTAGSTAARC